MARSAVLTVPPEYAERIKALRDRRGLSQTALADLLGVSFASVSRWEHRHVRPTPSAWRLIAQAETAGFPSTFATQGPRDLRADAAPYHAGPVGPPPLDFLGNADGARAVVESQQLAYSFLANPTFATEISLIHPLPHQRIAVYEHMLPQHRLRFLLADDAGAGKTIMTGLYIREMLMRRLISRVLIVSPAGLVGNWRRELQTLFNLAFRIVGGADAKAGNPFVGPASDQIIISLDTLTGDRVFGRLQDDAVLPYDLVIFDEAHKLAADREADLSLRRTDRYRLAETLAGIAADEPRWQLAWSARHLLLLTATPHMGKDYPYYCLWRLLEPEALATAEAFAAYPPAARHRHFIRRTKEEMVRLDGTPLYPRRLSDTFGYLLQPSEQHLYDETTSYIRFHYNKARVLNRSAAQLAMSVFQRRLVSSTYALLRSFERRLAKLEALIADIKAGRIRLDQARDVAERVAATGDLLDTELADDELTAEGEEENEIVEDRLLGGIAALTMAELEEERREVVRLRDLAQDVYLSGRESKFERLREILRDPQHRDEKLIIFTEHRDTLVFLRRRLESLGYTGQVAEIHGGMDYQVREEQVALFRLSAAQGGATYLLATDAAGEGINLQFCWQMVNYDVPWNPARLEQRMGRIHRYGQNHDPVVILNLVADRSSDGTVLAEGRVMATLLRKLEGIRREMQSDKVFDVIGRLFQNVSLRAYMERAVTDEGAEAVGRELEGILTKEQVEALQSRERALYGGGSVSTELPRLRAALARERLCTLLPGYLRRFLSRVAPLLDLAVVGDLDATFRLQAMRVGALDALWPILETYSETQRAALSVARPADPTVALFVHPGEPLFERLRSLVEARFEPDALRGALFVDPTADRPYFFHVAVVTVVRQVDPDLPAFGRGEVIATRLVGIRQEEDRTLSAWPVEHLLLLGGAKELPSAVISFAATGVAARTAAEAFARSAIAEPLAEERRQALLATLESRAEFVRLGFHYQDADLASARNRYSEKARAGDAHAKGEVTKIRQRQQGLAGRRDCALQVLRREPELIAVEDVEFVAHALVVPSSDPEERERFDVQTEAIAVAVARAYEEALGATVRDVSKAEQARAAGLDDWPGFDLLSHRLQGDAMAIEVKGRVDRGLVELSANEYARACNLGPGYWLYVVYGCGRPIPTLVRVQDPFNKLLFRATGSTQVGEQDVLAFAEADD
jgi:superfamily II DNA or RNA helicase/transcriptional regulator with XRE-family HTH domain